MSKTGRRIFSNLSDDPFSTFESCSHYLETSCINCPSQTSGVIRKQRFAKLGGRGRLTNGRHTDFPSLKHIRHSTATLPLTLNLLLRAPISFFMFMLLHFLLSSLNIRCRWAVIQLNADFTYSTECSGIFVEEGPSPIFCRKHPTESVIGCVSTGPLKI